MTCNNPKVVNYIDNQLNFVSLEQFIKLLKSNIFDYGHTILQLKTDKILTTYTI